MGFARCEIYSGSFSKHPEWTGTINATVERIGEAISGTVSHELAHLINCYHAYMFETFDPTITGAISSEYYPKEPSDLPVQITENDGYNHIMATWPYISNEQRATLNRYFSSHSVRTISFANSGGCNVNANMTWGLFNKSFNQLHDITIAPGATLYIGGYWYAHNLNSKSLSGGTIIQASLATINGCNAKVKNVSTVKGLFPTIQPAINFASSGNTVEISSGSFNETLSFNNKQGLTVVGQVYTALC
ncbi:MAG: hypothetical protein FD143_3301 [Ignavibacteria bacterium]|nr:MAG: hypothetical protein FD143_3301 [Ignavibacteria bacterium]KAF0152917.1 MAG: hypothetical protein FD188_3392 [Ignavibacteria bacterium]